MVQKLFLVLGAMFLAGSMHAQHQFYEKGWDSYNTGKYEEAIRLFSEYLPKKKRDKTKDVEVYYLRGLSYYKTENYKNAIADFDETLRRNHANKGNIYWFKAECHDRLNEHLEAIVEYTHALREFESDKDSKAKLFLARGKLYLKIGQTDRASEDFGNGLVLNPYYAELIELAAVYPVTGSASPSVDQKIITPVMPWQDKETEPVVAIPTESDSVGRLGGPNLDPGTNNVNVPGAIRNKPKDFKKNTPVAGGPITDGGSSSHPHLPVEEGSDGPIWNWIERNLWLILSLSVMVVFFVVGSGNEISKAEKRVSYTRYLRVILAIITSLTLIKTYQISYKLALWGTVVAIFLMTIILVLDRLTKEKSSVFRGPAVAILWTISGVFILVIILLFTSVFFRRPLDLTFVVE